jgi:glutaredoxin 3
MLLTRKAIQFEDFDVSADPALLTEMQERSGKRTVPQIFVGDTPIGGFDELYALDNSGELDRMLADQIGGF